ncbi:LysR substrate-binding domain-containing protein [Rhizobium leguminosarum]|uniref:HTH-type transcriptional regulator TtuA n=2 Tax=Rhizobium leguminosarum TaxID=384 RepID=A0A154IMV5_RHILE|nr:LysR substrate-binding domain-containing protein [Rhizobium leguminosarum]KZB01756.1 hypothetical protein A4A59_11980 [Rhizobium leguminosarum]
MELRTLRYFVAVAEELHFGRAAQRLNMAQPPLSQQIQKLEVELGVQLLTRTKRTVSLTQPGELLLASARLILQQAQTAVAGVRAAGQGVVGSLAIGMINAVSLQGQIYDVLRRYHEEHPGVGVTIKIMTSVEALRALRTEDIQVALLRAPLNDRTIQTEVIMTEQLLLAVPENHPLAKTKGSVRVSELGEEPFVMLPRSAGFGLSEQIMQICKKAGFSPKIHQDVYELPTICGLVAAGFGVSLVPSSALISPQRGAVFKALEPNEFVDTLVAYRAPEKSPPLGAFLEVLRQHPKINSSLDVPRGSSL